MGENIGLWVMEQKNSWIKLTMAAIASAVLLSNCVTSYDQYGRPIQTADPAAVAIGAVALGAIAYSAGKSDSHQRGHYRSRNYGYRGSHGYHGYRGCR